MRCELTAEFQPLLHFLVGVHLRHVIQAGNGEQTLPSVLRDAGRSDGECGPVTIDRFLQRPRQPSP